MLRFWCSLPLFGLFPYRKNDHERFRCEAPVTLLQIKAMPYNCSASERSIFSDHPFRQSLTSLALPLSDRNDFRPVGQRLQALPPPASL